MFIELTDISGVKFLVNINHVIGVTDTDDGISLTTAIIQETYDDIKDLIAH